MADMDPKTYWLTERKLVTKWRLWPLARLLAKGLKLHADNFNKMLYVYKKLPFIYKRNFLSNRWL